MRADPSMLRVRISRKRSGEWRCTTKGIDRATRSTNSWMRGNCPLKGCRSTNHICHWFKELNCRTSHPRHEDGWFVPVRCRSGLRIASTTPNNIWSNAVKQNWMACLLTHRNSSHSRRTILFSYMSRKGWQWSSLTLVIMRGAWRMFLKWTMRPTTQRSLFYFKWLMWIPEWSPGSILRGSLILFQRYETNDVNCLPSPLLALFRLSTASWCRRERIEQLYSGNHKLKPALVDQAVSLGRENNDWNQATIDSDPWTVRLILRNIRNRSKDEWMH